MIWQGLEVNAAVSKVGESFYQPGGCEVEFCTDDIRLEDRGDFLHWFGADALEDGHSLASWMQHVRKRGDLPEAAKEWVFDRYGEEIREELCREVLS